MVEFVDKTLTTEGTPLNRANLMALQGFEKVTAVFSPNKIVETNENGHTTTTLFGSDGTIVETFVGVKTITKKTTFDESGYVTEVI